MPTFDPTDAFVKDLRRLSGEQRIAFRRAVAMFVADLRRRQGFRKGLRVKKLQGYANIVELTWAPDGRATWQYGDGMVDGEPHIVWRRVGTHDIFDRP